MDPLLDFLLTITGLRLILPVLGSLVLILVGISSLAMAFTLVAQVRRVFARFRFT